MPKRKNLSETHSDMSKRKRVDEKQNQVQIRRRRSKGRCNSDDLFEGCVKASMANSSALESRKPILENVMEALADPNTHSIGVYGEHKELKYDLLEKINRRIQRDKLFDLVLTATVTKKSDVKKIQDELARQLGLTLNQKFKDTRANELSGRIKKEKKILIILRDLYKGLDLGKVGVPYGADHKGCKILLTSTTRDVLSNRMHTQMIFMV